MKSEGLIQAKQKPMKFMENSQGASMLNTRQKLQSMLGSLHRLVPALCCLWEWKQAGRLCHIHVTRSGQGIVFGKGLGGMLCKQGPGVHLPETKQQACYNSKCIYLTYFNDKTTNSLHFNKSRNITQIFLIVLPLIL